MARLAFSWLCFWLGDLTSRIVEPFFGQWFEWPYAVYNKLMIWSDSLQGDDPRGPWQPAIERGDGGTKL